VLPRHRPKSNGPEDHGLTPLKPWAKQTFLPLRQLI
jgi:hypothetical protein